MYSDLNTATTATININSNNLNLYRAFQGTQLGTLRQLHRKKTLYIFIILDRVSLIL